MKTDALVSRNTVLLFDNILTRRFIRFSEKINRRVPSKVVLNTKDMIPHLTIYSTRYPKRNLGKIERRVAELAEDTKPFGVRFSGKSIIAGTIFIDAEISKDIYDLHEKFVDGLNSLREGSYDEKELLLPGLTKGMKASLLKYGMLLAKEEYLSHVTLARPFKSQRCQEALNLLPDKIDLKARITNISIVATGPNGTCKRVITTPPFGVV